MQPREVRPARRDEARQPLQLRHANRRLHVGRLEIVAQLGIGVLVIVAMRQVAQLPVEPLAARVVLARFAPAVASPVPHRLGDPLERGRGRQHTAALAHGDVVRGIKAHGRQLAEGSYRLAVVGGAERVAAVLDQVEIMFAAERRHGAKIERVAKGVRDHHRARSRAQGAFEMRHVDAVGAQLSVDEYRDQPVLHDRVHRGRESRRRRDHLVARLHAVGRHHRRAERAHGNEVGR